MTSENSLFPADGLPRISVVIPVAPGGSVKTVLDSLANVEYPKEKVEIIVVEGKQPSFQRNEAVKQASGDILYFLDSDSEADIDLFRLVARAFNSYKDKNVAVVGGPSEILESDSLLQRCFGYVLSSYFAVASVRCRYRSINRQPCLASERMLILANMA
ncbi:MAG: glycosyltransferase, partial [Chloroflexota bacterium]